MRTGIVEQPLHGGQCPPWLFEKMKRLAAAIIQVIVYEYGASEVLRRLADPLWFQAFGCVLGFDWHSSGLTTVVCGSVKEGLSGMQGELGLFLAGGKGRASRKTPREIESAGEKYGLSNDLAVLQRTSRLVAKVDSAAVQDGYQLYHHFFVFDKAGNWAVVQQGMNAASRYARRYHWRSEGLGSFVNDPHQGIAGRAEDGVLNLVSAQNKATRIASVELCREKATDIVKIIRRISVRTAASNEAGQLCFWGDNACPRAALPAFHAIPRVSYLDRILHKLYDKPPGCYEGLLEAEGVGPGTLRALAMVAEVTHGVKPSFEDPVRYSFAHGGKDGFPFPVRRDDMEGSIRVLQEALEKAKIGHTDRMAALRRLSLNEQGIAGRASNYQAERQC